MREVAIIGVGMHKFGRFEGREAASLGLAATVNALKDAGVDWKQVQAVFAGTMFGEPGDRIINQLGLTGVPLINVSNACATGGSALRLAYQAIASGFYDMCLAVGYEKMPRGFISTTGLTPRWVGETGLAVTVQSFAMNIRRHMEEYGTTEDHLVKVSVKAHRNGALNPNAMYQREMSYEEIAGSIMVCDPLRLYMLCAPNEGGAAAVLCSLEMARRFTSRPITIAATALRTRHFGALANMGTSASSRLQAPTLTQETAREAYQQAGVGPEDLHLVECQDTDAGSEILHTEELGLCSPGEGGLLVAEGATEITGRIPVNPSGGLMCSGEPIGASGLRQVHEVVLQLRGQAGPRQVHDPKVGLTHVFGAPGVSCVTILKS